ncbi:uncharacterized protein LOC131629444 [Vicia villosa]|uniref:uncharacterized protein LOC131629444 n=1 Tax=Vicia villosa TaxID=3911 RepID=UPI00273B8EDC|nr:uncharacterized protein LOC131629444 [Vicia villosa]
MTNPIADVPNETLNPEEEAPPTPHTDPQSPQALQNPQIESISTNPNPDHDTVMEDPNQSQIADDPEPDVPTPATTTRRGNKRKKTGSKRTAIQKKRFEEKCQTILETLKPIPFKPAKALDFDSHQSLLERLGLWGFVHIEFDSVIRTDLLAQLIVSYNPTGRCSYVNDIKVMVNRAELGRALKLPKKNPASAVPVIAVDEVDKEDIDFLNQLVSNWMLLHDDTFIMTKDIMQPINFVKDGTFEKVDWAGLIWSMLEKELKAPNPANCYYASHLQHLIKSQHKELLEETPVEGEGEEGVAKDEEEEGEAKDEEEEEEVAVIRDEVDGSGDVRMGGVEESKVRELDESNTELSLKQEDNVETLSVEKQQGDEEQIMDFEQSKEEEQEMWLFDQKNCVGEPSLRPCQNSDLKGMVNYRQVKEDVEEEGQEQEEEEEDEDAEEDEHEGGFRLSPKFPMEGLTSGAESPIQGMEAQNPFSSGIDLHDNSVGDFLSARDDPQMMTGSSLFGNGHKREIDLDNHNFHHTLNGSNKRLRNDSPWSSKPLDFEGCMEQMEHWMGKARMMYASKDQAIEESSMNQQVLLEELQRRDSMIEHLHKAKMEETQKRQIEVYRLEKELYMMQSLVEGYRKAVKETQKAFADYRARCPQADEPLYKDVPGSGGLVLSVTELEKERLKKEEEERIRLRELFRDFEKNCKDIEAKWMGEMGVLEKHLNKVESLGNQLQALDEKVKHLKEVYAKLKIPLETTPLSEAEAA